MPKSVSSVTSLQGAFSLSRFPPAIGYGSLSSSPSTEIYRSEPLTRPSSPQQNASISPTWRRSIAATSRS